MFAAGKTAAVSGETPDAQFNYVTMLLHGDGTNGAQNNTFLDSSTNNFTITRNGNTTQGSFSPYGSNWSNYFNETPNNYLSVANNAALNMGTGDFTVEAWINVSNIDFRCVVCLGQYNNGAGVLRITNSGNLQWYWNDASFIVTSSTTVTVGTWNHVAVVRSSGTTKLYINGTNSGSASDSNNYSSTYPTWVGAENQGSVASQFFGYISNVRVVKGTAVYTSNFTPSTTPLTAISGTSLLTCQSNRFIDNSSNAFSITLVSTPSVQRFNPFGASTAYSTSVIGGSGYFDGSGDYLTAPDNTALQFGTGDFTIECWVYLNAFASNVAATLCKRSSAAEDTTWAIDFAAGTGDVRYRILNSTGGVITVSIGTVSLGTWTHIAVSKQSGTTRTYLNGIAGGTTTNSTSIDGGTNELRIGVGDPAADRYINGYISNARLVKGTAVYTSAFTPPTSPVTAISGTSLLCNMTNAGIFDNAMMNDLETVGNAQISTSVKKYGTGSLAFDGTGDWMLGVNGQTINFGSGDFTVEFWINPTNWSNTYVGVIGCSTTNGLWIGKNASNFVLRSSNTADLVSYGTMPTTGTWTHIAITRSGTTARMFYDGTQVASGTTSNNFVEGPFYIGQDSGGNAFTGYLDDLRITKGYARYTSNFTAPTAAFSNTGPN